MKPWALLSICIFSIILVSGPVSGRVDPEDPVTAVADVTAILPGVPFHIGLHFRLEPGWYTYWRNPGDSGLPPDIRWTVPEGFKVGDILWPVPEMHTEEGITNFIYRPDVLLAVRITPPEQLEPGTKIIFAADASWLLCMDRCIAASGKFELVLPVAGGAKPPDPVDPKRQKLFNETFTRVPAEEPVLHPVASLAGGELLLQFAPSPVRDAMDAATVRIYPVTPMIVENSRIPGVSLNPDGLQVRWPLNPYGQENPGKLAGVIEYSITRGTGLERRVLFFEAVLTPEVSPAKEPQQVSVRSPGGVRGKHGGRRTAVAPATVPSMFIDSGSAMVSASPGSAETGSAAKTSIGLSMAGPLLVSKELYNEKHPDNSWSCVGVHHCGVSGCCGTACSGGVAGCRPWSESA